MNLFFTYHSGDAELAKNTATLINQLGPEYRGHKAVVASQKGTPFKDEIMELFQGFDCVEGYDIEHNLSGHALASARTFYEAANRMYEYGEPWYFYEPDVIPLKRGWLDSLTLEYHNCGKKHMGIMCDPIPKKGGKPQWRMNKRHGYVIGAAIYHHETKMYDLVRNLSKHASAYKETPSGHPYFDVYIFGDIRPDCHNTRQMQQMGRSRRFVCVNGVISFTPNPSIGMHGPDFLETNEVREEAVTVHGPKDGSIHDCVRFKSGIIDTRDKSWVRAGDLHQGPKFHRQWNPDTLINTHELDRLRTLVSKTKAPELIDVHLKFIAKSPAPFRGPCKLETPFNLKKRCLADMTNVDHGVLTKMRHADVINMLCEHDLWDHSEDHHADSRLFSGQKRKIKAILSKWRVERARRCFEERWA